MKAIRLTVMLVACAGLGLMMGSLLRARKDTERRAIVALESAFPGHEGGGQGTEAMTPTLGLIAQLQHNLSISTGVKRWLYWMEAIEKASLEEFPKLIQLAGNDGAAVRAIGLRWTELDPKHLLHYLTKSGDRRSDELLTEVLFPEWANRDPKGLIKELDEAPPLGPLRMWRSEAAEYITRYEPELGLPLFERWSIGMFTPSMRGVVKWAAKDPRHAAEFTMGIRSHYPSTEAMKTIGEQWAKIEPAAGMEYARTQQNSLGRTLASSILKTWAEKDLPSAAEWLVNADQVSRNRFSAPVVEQWAKSDPAMALRWCEQNLGGTSFTEAAASVLRGAAERDAQAAARLVQVMEPSAARSAAAVEVAVKLLPRPQGNTEPPSAETLAWLSSLDAEARGRVLQKAVRTWPDVDAKGMASFLLTTAAEKIPSSVYVLVGRSLARNDPTGALEWANQLPEEARLAGGCDAFARWCQAQPENAMQWLSMIPAHDERRTAYLKTALEYLAYEHNATERVAALPLLDRRVAFGLLNEMDLPQEKRERLLTGLQR